MDSSRSASPGPYQLAVRHLHCWHGDAAVVRDVSLQVDAGEHVAIIGGNGSGKSTLLRTIMGLHPAFRGDVAVDGQAAATASQWRDRRRRVAYMPQRQSVGQFPLLVRELLASSGNTPAADAAAAHLGLGALRNRPLHTLSGGQLQRAYLARALGMLADTAGLLLADEPTAALDFAGQADIAGLLEQLPATVVVVTHDRAVSTRCNRVLEMAGGQLRAVQP